MPGEVGYLDASALVKLVALEPESPAMSRFLVGWPRRVSSVITEVEVMRGVRRTGLAEPVQRAEALLQKLDLIELDREIRRDAGRLEPPGLRSLDVIHLASALSLDDDLGAFVTYDRRLADAAAAAGLPVISPA